MRANYSRLMIAFVATCWVAVGALGCGYDGGQNSANTANGDADAGTDANQDNGEADANSPSCEALTCADIASGCGTHNDQCGGEIDCGACACSPDSVDADCPSQPCMEAVGCNDGGECEYAPTACAGEVCDECADGSCTAEQLRACGPDNTCPVAFCDPDPQSDDTGQVTYQNTCRSEAAVPCGTCGLGTYQCGGDGSFECVEPPLPGDGELNANCESAVRPTFIYLDPNFEGDDEDADGTKEAPFTTMADAIDEIQIVDARVLVIGGAPEITVPQKASGRDDAPYYGFEVTEGISILGGFGGAPEFERDTEQRPTIYAADANIAVEAEDIESTTILAGVDFENSRDSITDTSYGAVIRRSPGLQLVDVHIRANSPDGVGEPITFADPMPASTTNRSPDQPPFEASDINELILGVDSCGGYEIPVNSDEYSNFYSNMDLSCPIFDDQAQAYYGEFVAEEVLGIPRTQGGTGSSSAGYYNELQPGGAGINPLIWEYEAAGGQWVGPYYDSEYAPAEDGAPYSGDDRFAGAGESGSGDGQLDSDRLWQELGDGSYGDIGYPGASGGGGGGRVARLIESAAIFGIDASDNGNYCARGLAGEHGGSGGCGGLGGRGGSGGAWVIGIFLDESAQTEFRDSAVSTGDAAPGQYGSAGGRPAPGASGGETRFYGVDYQYNNDALTLVQFSNPGGDGAAGQWGGHGGHGAGGSTVGVLQVGSEREEFEGLQMELGQPGFSPAAVDPYAPSDMPAPEAPGQADTFEIYTQP